MTERYVTDERSGIIVVYDTDHPKYKVTSGCHGDYEWTVAYWEGYLVDNEEGPYWRLQQWQIDKANQLCDLLNNK